MPYGSNDGYGPQQLRDRPSTGLTAVGRRHSAAACRTRCLGATRSGLGRKALGFGPLFATRTIPFATTFAEHTSFSMRVPLSARAERTYVHSRCAIQPPVSGSSMSTLISQGDEARRGASPNRHTSPGHAPPDCASFDPFAEEGTERVRRHMPVKLPQGASRKALLGALEQDSAIVSSAVHWYSILVVRPGAARSCGAGQRHSKSSHVSTAIVQV